MTQGHYRLTVQIRGKRPEARANQDGSYLVEISSEAHERGNGQNGTWAEESHAAPLPGRPQERDGAEHREEERRKIGGEIDQVRTARCESSEATRITSAGPDERE